MKDKVLNYFFDKIYVISFASETKKRVFLSNYLKKYNIEFDFFDAIDGRLDYNLLKKHKEYIKLSYSDLRSPKIDKEYQKKSLVTVGALGLLESYKNIFNNALENHYKYIMIMEEDVLLSKNLNQNFSSIINKIPEFDLLYFGASQYTWEGIEIKNLDNKIRKYDGKKYLQNIGYYNANKYTYGTFAVGYNCKIIPEIITLIDNLSGPIDSGCLREIIKNKKSTYVLYPNQIIADTTLESTITLQRRDLRNHKNNVKWDIRGIDFESNIWKVSILMANYNSENTITSSLKSIADQVYKNLELIIVDDASTDNSVEIIKGFIKNNKEINIKLIELKRNIGAYGCRNTALKKAKGEFITILDSDDILMPDKILKDVYNYFNKENYDIFFSKIYRSNTIEKSNYLSSEEALAIINKERDSYKDVEEHKKPWEYKIRFGIQTIFANKNFFKEYGYWRSDYKYGMDIDLMQRYIYKKYNKYVDHQELWNDIYSGNSEKYGIFLSNNLGLISHKLNQLNATNICKKEERKKIHKECEKDFSNQT